MDFANFKRLIYCCLILIKHSVCKLDFNKKSSRSAVIKIQTSFCLLLFAFPHERTEEIISIVFKFMDDENIWNYEAVSIEIFQCLLTSCECAEMIFHRILDRIQVMVSESLIAEAQCCARILYSIININFNVLSRYGLMRMIKFYHVCIKKTEHEPLQIGLKVALAKLLRFMPVEMLNEILPDILDLAIDLEFNFHLREFAAIILRGFSKLSTNVIAKNLSPDIFDKILFMMASECVITSNIACRFLTTLIDHYQNSNYFLVPMVFFLYTNYGFSRGSVKDQAIAIIDNFSEKLEESLVRAVELHGDSSELILSIYKLLCVMLTSLPSGKINIMIIKILLKFQSFALEEEVIEENKRNCIHVVIISIMTLMCYISRAKTLSAYIHNIVCIRFDKAGHLNPPIRMRRPQDELYLGSELFLDKWDLRYCLWKRYRFGDILRSKSFDSLTFN